MCFGLDRLSLEIALLRINFSKHTNIELYYSALISPIRRSDLCVRTPRTPN